MKALLIAASLALTVTAAGCAGTPMWDSGATGTTSGAGMMGQSGEVIVVPDPAGSATHGTGSVGVDDREQREAFASGEGLD